MKRPLPQPSGWKRSQVVDREPGQWRAPARTARFAMRVTVGDQLRWAGAADAAGYRSVSDWARDALNAAAAGAGAEPQRGAKRRGSNRSIAGPSGRGRSDARDRGQGGPPLSSKRGSQS